ncbi:SPOR domain-containing protein [Photobacterium andalusiense]|uniref:Sporulation related domain protein n=1 Tax=Photobacterium andalusiense TaxID=2204296 RepID=A0A1Y6MDY2_9GAMM|nr:SPOR domain-containing protein [Photobacterium andalusiense]SMY34765.1 Sporulation related domain protein [Photobacterium andalusiense]
MKKIIALSLLSSLVGCTQLMPPKIPLQTPIDTINTTKMTDNFSEPKVVAELDASVKTDPLYQSSDSIAVSEQQIEAPAPSEPEVAVAAVEPAVEPTAANNEAAIVTDSTDAVEATDAAQSNSAASIDNAEVAPAATPSESAAVEPAVEPTAANNEAAIVTDSTDAVETTDAAQSNPAASIDNAEVAPAATPSEPAAVEPTAAMTEPVSEATPETTVVEEAPQTNEDGYKTVDMHGYSIQITASRDEPSLIALLSLLESQQPAWINKKMLNGSQVYTLLLGHYADYEQAKAGLTSLPQAVQNNGAFVRNFYDIEHTGSPQLKQLQ